MPAAKQSGRSTRATSRGRAAASNGSRSSRPQSRSNAKSRGGSTRRSQAQATANGSRSRSSNSSSNHDALVNVGISALSATIGVAGGVLLGRSALQHNRKVLGVAVPSRLDLSGVGQQIGEAGRQFGKLATEVRAVREKAEQIGRILT